MPQLTALVVEDDVDIQTLLVRHLERLGMAIQLAPTGEFALASVAHAVPDLVLLDLCLPGMQGEAVLAHLRSQPATAATPVVIVSVADAGAVEVVGHDAWLAKPFTGRELEQVVRRVLPVTEPPTVANAS